MLQKHQISLFHSYAAATQLYVRCDNDETTIQLAIRLEHCIADVCKWMKNNALKLNEEKTEFIIFGVHPSQHNNISLRIGSNYVINLSESIKILGITPDSKMNMKKHIINTCRFLHAHPENQ